MLSRCGSATMFNPPQQQKQPTPPSRKVVGGRPSGHIGCRLPQCGGMPNPAGDRQERQARQFRGRREVDQQPHARVVRSSSSDALLSGHVFPVNCPTVADIQSPTPAWHQGRQQHGCQRHSRTSNRQRRNAQQDHKQDRRGLPPPHFTSIRPQGGLPVLSTNSSRPNSARQKAVLTPSRTTTVDIVLAESTGTRRRAPRCKTFPKIRQLRRRSTPESSPKPPGSPGTFGLARAICRTATPSGRPTAYRAARRSAATSPRRRRWAISAEHRQRRGSIR